MRVGRHICVCVRVLVYVSCALPLLFPHLVHEFDGREAPALGFTHEVRVSAAVGPQQVDVDGHGLRRCVRLLGAPVWWCTVGWMALRRSFLLGERCDDDACQAWQARPKSAAAPKAKRTQQQVSRPVVEWVLKGVSGMSKVASKGSRGHRKASPLLRSRRHRSAFRE